MFEWTINNTFHKSIYFFYGYDVSGEVDFKLIQEFNVCKNGHWSEIEYTIDGGYI